MPKQNTLNLKWKKVTDEYIEAYLGDFQILSLQKLTNGNWQWACELPFTTDSYYGRPIGTAKTAKRAALDAVQKAEEWISRSKIFQTT